MYSPRFRAFLPEFLQAGARPQGVNTMETVVNVVVILAMIAVGVLVIHRLNAQTGNKIAPDRHSDLPARHRHRHRRWGRGRPHRGHGVAPPRV